MTGTAPDNSEPLFQIGELTSILHELLYPPPIQDPASQTGEDSETTPDSGMLNPDILTLADFRRRYQFTGLGGLAVTAIERAQRIIRSGRNFLEIGLCEFHIGLIYLDQDDCQGAIQQFQEARLQWSFIDQTAAVCLTHFAEGLAQHHRCAYELALSQFQKVLNCQKRIEFEPSSDELEKFKNQLKDFLKKAQDASREALWTLIPTPSVDEAEEDSEGDEEDTAVSSPPEGKVEPESIGVLPPVFPQQKQAGLPFPFAIPQNGELTWYQAVIKRRDPIFPEITKPSWLLVHQPEGNRKIKENSLVVIASNDLNTEASIVLKPLIKNKEQAFPRIFLARKKLEGPFSKEDNQVTLSSEIRSLPIDIKDFLGYVVGLWLEIGESGILES